MRVSPSRGNRAGFNAILSAGVVECSDVEPGLVSAYLKDSVVQNYIKQ